MKIIPADKSQAPEIASLIMEAMNYECCKNLAGESHTLRDFFMLMTSLVEREDSQYSYLNTDVALNDQGIVTGACVSYDGGSLLSLREAFIEEALWRLGIDYSQMDPETQNGEFYIDSLCVHSNFRRQGIATALLQSALHKAQRYGLPAGLLVDNNNPKAEQLYRRMGFTYRNASVWSGHAMKHLVHPLPSASVPDKPDANDLSSPEAPCCDY